MRSKAITRVILAVIICLIATTRVASATTWKTASADVDWDASTEAIYYKTDETDGVYPWRAPFLMASGVPRVAMGAQNLREIVYFQGERILDEGYWDGPPAEHYAGLYNSKDTFVDGEGYIVTRWESDYAILNRTADFTNNGCTLKYEIWLQAFGYEPGPEPLAEIGMGILWNIEPRVGTPGESLSYIIARMESYYDEYAGSYKGICNPDLSFMINYTFDDTMKHVNNYSLIAWDGTTPYEYLSAGISYEDSDFSPLTTGLPWQEHGSKAIWGTVHLPMPVGFSVTTGQFVGEDWQGVGVTGKYSQETCAEYRSIATIGIDPETLNVGPPSGPDLTAYIEFLPPYDVHDIDVTTIRLNDSIPIIFYDFQVNVLTVKFDRDAVIALINPPPPPPDSDITFEITGNLIDGTPFHGSDTVWVISRGKR